MVRQTRRGCKRPLEPPDYFPTKTKVRVQFASLPTERPHQPGEPRRLVSVGSLAESDEH